MKTVQTVIGNVDTNKLGSVLMHEHIYSSSMGVALSYPQLYKEGTEEKIEKDLKEMKANGMGGLPLFARYPKVPDYVTIGCAVASAVILIVKYC